MVPRNGTRPSFQTPASPQNPNSDAVNHSWTMPKAISNRTFNHRQIRQLFLKLAIKHAVPSSILHDNDFQALLETVNPGEPAPSQQTLDKDIRVNHAEKRRQVKNVLKVTCFIFSFTYHHRITLQHLRNTVDLYISASKMNLPSTPAS